jgi:hypothetical protein
MKITTIYPDDKSFPKVLERFNQAADARGVPREDAMIAAMLLWLGAESTTWVTDEEWRELAPALERMRARNRPSGPDPGLGSSGKEPER